MKKIFLLLFVLLFTGCDVVYNLDIDNNFLESSEFFMEESDNAAYNEFPKGVVQRIAGNLDELINKYYSENYSAMVNPLFSNEYYKKEKLSDNKGIKLYYDFTPENYKYSFLVDYCFENISIKKNKKDLILNLKNSSNCFFDIYDRINSIRVNIKTDYEVIDNNADKVSNGVYSWFLSNSSDEKIYMKIKMPDDIKDNNSIFIWIMICFFVLFLFISVYFIIRKKNKSNQI